MILLFFITYKKYHSLDENPQVGKELSNYWYLIFLLGLVILKKSLDYERVSSYNIDIEAADRAGNGEDRLAARSSIIVEVSW